MTQVGSVSLLGRMLGRRPWYQRCSDGLDVVLQGQEICRRQADLPGRQKSPGTHKTANICGVSVWTVVAFKTRVRDELGRQSTVQWKEGREGQTVCRAEPVSQVTAAQFR